MPKVTIIIPVYNVENYLDKCLNSIILQTLKDIQVILVNDGSTDSSEEIIDKYIKKYPNIFEKINKVNGGQGSARNKGIDIARGEYTLFIDSDDYIEKDMISLLYEKAIKNRCDVVVCDYYEVTNNKKISKKAMMSISNDYKINFMLSNPSPWNKLIRTSILKKNNIRFLENHIYEDLATIPILTCYIDKIGYLKKPLYNYIIRNGSTMRQNKYNKKLESIFDALKFLEDQFEERGFGELYKNELEYLNILHLLYASTGRFLQYPNTQEILQKIKYVIKQKYPKWKKNKYYVKMPIKFKILCNIFYKNKLINLYLIIKKLQYNRLKKVGIK